MQGQGQVLTSSSSSSFFTLLLLLPSTLEVMDHGANERSDWEPRRKSGCCVGPDAN